MASKKMPPVDAVLVGFGWTGAIMGMELTGAGLKVLALERGEMRDTNHVAVGGPGFAQRIQRLAVDRQPAAALTNLSIDVVCACWQSASTDCTFTPPVCGRS